MPKILTSEPMPWMIFLFGWIAGLLFLFAGLGTFQAIHYIRTEPLDCQGGYTDFTCTPVEQDALGYQTLAWVALMVFVAVLVWRIGTRYRVVSLMENGEVHLVWGERFPITLRRFVAKDLSDFVIHKELRFQVMPIVGTSVNRMRRAPDRWRLKAQYQGGKVNLGSYASEAGAQAAVAAIRAV